MDNTTPLRLLQTRFAHMSCLLDRPRGCLPPRCLLPRECILLLPLLLLALYCTVYTWQ